MSTASVLPVQELDSGFVDVVRKTLERSDTPLSASGLLTGPFRVSAKVLEQRLDAMAERGEVFIVSKYRGAKQYWSRDLETYAREEILRQLSAGPLTRSELKSKLKAKLSDVSTARQDAIFKTLLDQGAFQKLPRYIGARSDRFSTRAAACAIVEQWNHPPVRAEESVIEVEPAESLDLSTEVLSRMEEIEPRARELAGFLVGPPGVLFQVVEAEASEQGPFG